MDISLFEAVADVLVPAGMAKMFVARVDDQPAAASVELPFNRIIYSWFSGYDPDFRKAYPNDHLVWHILEWGATRGYEVFDFGGAGPPGQKYGPRDFKSKYSGRTVCFGRFVHSSSALTLTLSRNLYKAYRSVMQVLTLPARQSGLSRQDAPEPQ